MKYAAKRPRTEHALVEIAWSGEYGENSSATGICRCGWEESASSQREVRHEYRCHLDDVKRRGEHR